MSEPDKKESKLRMPNLIKISNNPKSKGSYLNKNTVLIITSPKVLNLPEKSKYW